MQIVEAHQQPGSAQGALNIETFILLLLPA
jgi:hypothetical protein